LKRSYTLKGVTFEVDARYQVKRRLWAGTFGMVCEAVDESTGEMVAVKRIKQAFDDLMGCKRALREIKLMRHFKHENIVGLRDIMLPSEGGWNDLYLVVDLMDVDLHFIIHSGQPLQDGYLQYFMYQLMRGLKAIHSAKAIHRDLKPSNLLVNKNGDLRIADFGLARAVEEANPQLTEYVVTRWYRAPELVVQSSSYGQTVDIWSAGCILAECLGRTVLLPGKDYMGQMRLIVELLAPLSAADLEQLQNPSAVAYIRHLPQCPAVPLSSRFPAANPAALDLLSALLVFDPRRRLSAASALCHAYLGELNEMNDAPDAGPFDFAAIEHQGVDLSDLRDLVWRELEHFHPEVGPVPPNFSDSPARVMDLGL